MFFRNKISRIALWLPVAMMLLILINGCSKEESGINPNPTLPDLDLRSADNQYDYLIICHPDWYHDLEQFADFRENTGLATLRIPLSEITEQFPDTASISQSIQDFISYALSNWQAPQPQYLLLAGNTAKIPSVTLPSRYIGGDHIDETNITFDTPYSINRNDGDLVPDIAVGRFPAANTTELQSIIDKTIAFENRGDFSDFANELLYLADLDSGSSNLFERLADDFVREFPELNPAVRFDIRQDSPFGGSQNDFFNHLDTGVLHLLFMGHGSSDAWSRENFLTVNDVDNLPDTDRSFIFYGLTPSQSFDDPRNVSLVEQLVLDRDGGAVASIAPTGIIFLFPIIQFIDVYFEHITGGLHQRLGEAFLASQREFQSPGLDIDSDIRRYSLLGDPALKLPIR